MTPPDPDQARALVAKYRTVWVTAPLRQAVLELAAEVERLREHLRAYRDDDRDGRERPDDRLLTEQAR